MNHNQDNISRQLKQSKRWYKIIAIMFIMGFIYVVAIKTTDFSVKGSSASALQTLKRLFIDPLLSAETRAELPKYIGFMLETIAIAYAGCLVASILAIPLGFLSARNMSYKFSYIGKIILNGIRAIPELIFAIIFVAAVGMGPYAGVLAISINSIGMLGKLYAEVIESMDMRNVEAIKASGGNRIQTIWYGMLPQVIPEFSSYALYRFEIDIRSSTVLGIVGAGGIGAPLLLATYQRNWEDVGMILFVVVIAVSLIDILSGKIRGKLV